MNSNKSISDLRAYLQDELARRCKSNPNYSLRSFARYLGVDGSLLSKILAGKRLASRETITKVGRRLGLPTEAVVRLQQAHLLKKHRLEEIGPQSAEQDNFLQLSLDQFEVIADSNHYSILELMKLDGFSPEPRWISKKLGISLSEVRSCIERLQRIGLLAISFSGKWTDLSSGFSTHVLGNNVTSEAHKTHQRQILQKAIDAIDQVPIEKRDQSSISMATSYERIEEAKERIRKFRRELCAFLEAAPIKDTVFQMSVSLFPLTKGEK